jgi:hypothetical protein
VSRPAAVAVVVLAVLLVWGLMYVGWQGRRRRQGDVLAPQQPPEELVERALAEGAEATYVSTSASGDRFDRIAVHGLGHRSAARVLVLPEGVVVARTGAPDLLVPVADLRAARREGMRAGKAVPGDGLLVWDWALGDTVVSTAVRPRYAADRTALTDQLHALVAEHPEPGESA